MTSYTNGIPRPGQSLGNSRPRVQENFDYINTTLRVNHYFNEVNQGKHKFVELFEQATDPAPAGQTDTLFTKVGGGYAIGELYYVRGGGGTPILMTDGDPVNAATGSTFLPGGIVMQWGLVTLNGSGVSANIPFSPTFSLLGINTAPWNIQVTFANTTFTGGTLPRSVGISARAYDKFSISSYQGASQEVFWFAIGPKT